MLRGSWPPWVDLPLEVLWRTIGTMFVPSSVPPGSGLQQPIWCHHSASCRSTDSACSLVPLALLTMRSWSNERACVMIMDPVVMDSERGGQCPVLVSRYECMRARACICVWNLCISRKQPCDRLTTQNTDVASIDEKGNPYTLVSHISSFISYFIPLS